MPDRRDWPGSAARTGSIDREIAAASARFWQAATARLAREINFGWWLAGWLPWAVAIGLAGTFAMLFVRWRGGAPGLVWAGIAAALGVAAVAAWLLGRRRFETIASARVRLEEAVGLKARLTAASAGVGPWPERPPGQRVAWPVRWRWQRPVGWAAVIAALLGLAAQVPMATPAGRRGHVIEMPPDVRTVSTWLEDLARERAVDERSIERVRERIAEVLQRPDDEWYEHASLEAAGTLREQTAADLRELAENLATAEQAAAALQAMTDAVPEPVREALGKDLKLAALALELGGFQPPQDLAELLRAVQDRDLGGLTPAECRGLAQRLRDNRESLSEALAAAPGLDGDGIPRNAAGPPGMGDVQRGPGDAELTRGDEHALGTKRKEKVTQPLDPERAAPTDLLAVVEGEHEIDETAYAGPEAGGAAKEGDGGAAALVDSLLPAEQAAVRRFFE